MVAVPFWVDKKGKEHSGFVHALTVEVALAEAIDSVLKRLTLLEEEIGPRVERIRRDTWYWSSPSISFRIWIKRKIHPAQRDLEAYIVHPGLPSPSRCSGPSKNAAVLYCSN
jgi:hypothetical protein